MTPAGDTVATAGNVGRLVGILGVCALLVGSPVAGVASVGPAVAQDQQLTVESVGGEDPNRTNNVTYHDEAGFELTVAGIDPGEWFVTVDIGDHRTSTDVTDQTVVVKPRGHDLEEGQYTLVVTAKGNNTTLTAETEIRITDAGYSEPVADNLSIESVGSENPNRINNVTYHDEAGFELTVAGIDPSEWFVTVDIGGHRTSTDVTDQTVVVKPRRHDLEEGQVYTLTVTAGDQDKELTANTEIRITDAGYQSDEGRNETRTEVGPDSNRTRTGPNTTVRVTDTNGPYGLPPGAEPTQELRVNLEFTERTETAIRIELFGDEGLPEGIAVQGVSAESPWPTEVSQTETGIRVHIDGSDGPATGELRVTIEFDATEVYEEGVEAQRGTRYRIVDDTGDRIGMMGVILWSQPLNVVVETPEGERLKPNTDRENWREYYEKGSSPYDPSVEVFTGDGSGYDTNSSFTVPTADGVWTFGYDAERYIRVNVDGYPDPAVAMADIDPTQHRWREDAYVVHLSEGGDVRMTLADDDGEPFPDGRLEVEDEDGLVYQLEANDDGVVRETLSPGTYTGWAAAPTALPAPDIEFTVEEGKVTETEIELRTPEVVNSEVEHVGGTAPQVDAIDVDSIYYEGAVLVALKPAAADGISREDVNESGIEMHLQDLSELGVDETTELRITLEIEEFDPDGLVWAARDTRWNVVEEDTDRAVVAIETKATELQQIERMHTGFGSGEHIDWPAGEEDVADVQYDAVVHLLLFDVDAIGDQGDVVQGLSVTTNAQVFSVPQIQERGLSLYMAAPGETVDGEPYTGYYQAFLPDSLLDEWNVDDPEADLEVRWGGDPENFEVTDVEGGTYVEIEPVHYSDGTMEIRSVASSSDQFSLLWVVTGIVIAVVVGAGIVLSRRWVRSESEA